MILLGGLAAGVTWWVFHDSATTALPDPVAAGPKPAPLLARAAAAPISLPSADATDDELLRVARLMVGRSASQALVWAQTVDDPVLRQRLHLAVLQAWGEVNLADATAWAVNQEDDPRADLRGALAGAMRQPALAIQLGREILAQNSPYAGLYGAALIDALGAAGQFQAALQFAAAAPADYQEDWLSAGFRNWAAQQPAQALQALDTVTDPDLRDSLFRAIVQGSSNTQPAALAAYALTLPPDQQAYALNQSLYHWSQQDPVNLANWLVNLPPGENFDTGAFFLLNENNSANFAPATAMTWVQSIGDPALQRGSFNHILEQWSQTDPAAARNYVEQARWLQPDDQADILQKLGTPW
jgi:hypothetical protein